MRIMLVCLLAVTQSALFADSVTTAEGKTFEGIVSTFDQNKKLTLATGYGDLTFVVATDVADATCTDYVWPKSSTLKQPARAAGFKKWADDRAAAKAPPVPTTDWKSIAKTAEADESKPEDLWRTVDACLAAQDDPNKSVKEREAAFAAVEKLNGKWFYACFALNEVRENDDTLEMEFAESVGTWDDAAGDWKGNGFVAHDPRTGKPTEACFTGLAPVSARKNVNGVDVDKLNEAKDRQGITVDYDEAATWKRDTGVIFRIELVVEDDTWKWVMRPARFRPLVAPKVKRE